MEGLKHCRKQDGEQLEIQPKQFAGDNFSGEPSTSQMLEAIFKESPDYKYATLMQDFATLRTESEEISVSRDQDNYFAANWKDDNLTIATSSTETIVPVNSTSISEKYCRDQMNPESLVSNENQHRTSTVEGFEDIDTKRKNSSFYCCSEEEEIKMLSMKDSKMKAKNCESLCHSTGATLYSPSVTATCVTENGRQQVHINVYAKEAAVVNVEAKNCATAIVGDGSQVNIFQGNCSGCGRRGPSTRSSNEGLEFDGSYFTVAEEENLKKARKRRKVKKKKMFKESYSDSNSNPENALKQGTKNKWRFESVLSEFMDSAAVESNVIQWVGNLVSYLLCSALDLQNDGVKLLLEEAKAIREDVPNCIRKINEAIELMRLENCEFQVAAVLPELQFALAEFYSSKDDYESALGCLKKLEESGLYKDTEKSRLYAKTATLIENACYARFEVSTEISEPGSRALLDSVDAAKRYFQKALEWNDKEPSTETERQIQRCCYLGMAALQMRLRELQREEAPDLKDLEKAKDNLELVGKTFCGITADMKCQFYMLEAYLRYFKGDFRMAASRVNDATELAQENCFLEARGCVGSRKLVVLSKLLTSCSSGFEGQLSVLGAEETLADDEDSGGNDDLESLISSDSDD